jgi:hypothetical protein
MGLCYSAPRVEELWDHMLWQRDVDAFIQGKLPSATGMSCTCSCSCNACRSLAQVDSLGRAQRRARSRG